MKAVYRRLVRERRKLGVTETYWYSWATEYDTHTLATDVSYRFAGLTRVRNGVFSRMPILRTYARLAAKYQGCRKGSNARRCR